MSRRTSLRIDRRCRRSARSGARSALLVATTCLTAITAAQGIPQLGADAGAYLDYLSMKASGSVCGERMLGFAGKFEPWFAAWQRKHFAQLSRGPSALARQQEQAAVNYQELVSKAAQALRDADHAAAIRECAILLDAVRPNGEQ